MMKAVMLLFVVGTLFAADCALGRAKKAGLSPRVFRPTFYSKPETLPVTYKISCVYSSNSRPVGRNPPTDELQTMDMTSQEDKVACAVKNDFSLGGVLDSECGSTRGCCYYENCNGRGSNLLDRAWVDYTAEKTAEAMKKQ